MKSLYKCPVTIEEVENIKIDSGTVIMSFLWSFGELVGIDELIINLHTVPQTVVIDSKVDEDVMFAIFEEFERIKALSS